MATQLIPRGIRKSSAIITLAAAGAGTAENLFLQSAGMTIARTVILRKIWAYSAVGNVTIQIGTGVAAAFAALYPPFMVLNTFDFQLTEDEIPEIEINGNLTVLADILGCLVQVEVEEVGSS